MAGEGDWPVRAREVSISSWVRFLERRKATRCSMGADATEGSWRTGGRSGVRMEEEEEEVVVV